ncbi:carboxypeptidase regulatory-like domain-containing protein [bacterium]|nr:carboxypeptidase regulatory-like domain-containing protein [bacterium]
MAQITVPGIDNRIPTRFGVCERNGAYKIMGLHSGEFDVEVQAAGYSSSSKGFMVTLGEETENANITLVAQTTIAGVVKSHGNGRLENPRVMLLDASNQVVLQTVPDNGGNYILSPLSDGSHSVKASALGMKSQTIANLNAGDRADFTLSPLIGKDEAISYPNSSRGDRLTFLYWLEEDATVLIRVYNQSAELVWDWEGPGIGGRFNRHHWQVSGVAPGVYLYKVTARNNQGSVSSFKDGKLTVIK